MEKVMLDLSLADRIADRIANRMSEIQRSISGREAVFQKISIDLSTARGENNGDKISIPFRSVFVRNATDTSAVCYLSPGENHIGAMASAMRLYNKDSFDFGKTLANAFLWWPAQAGKTIDLYLSTEGAMTAGSQISTIAGGLSISEGSALSSAKLGALGTAALVTVTSATAILILAADADRKNVKIYTSQDIWIGDASVAVGARGAYQPAGWFEWPSTALLYAIAVGADATVTGNDLR